MASAPGPGPLHLLAVAGDDEQRVVDRQAQARGRWSGSARTPRRRRRRWSASARRRCPRSTGRPPAAAAPPPPGCGRTAPTAGTGSGTPASRRARGPRRPARSRRALAAASPPSFTPSPFSSSPSRFGGVLLHVVVGGLEVHGDELRAAVLRDLRALARVVEAGGHAPRRGRPRARGPRARPSCRGSAPSTTAIRAAAGS